MSAVINGQGRPTFSIERKVAKRTQKAAHRASGGRFLGKTALYAINKALRLCASNTRGRTVANAHTQKMRARARNRAPSRASHDKGE